MAEKDHDTHEVPVTVRVYGKDTLFLRMAGCEATDGEGRKYDCGTGIGSGNPMIVMPDGRWAVFSWADLIRAGIAALETQDKAKAKGSAP